MKESAARPHLVFLDDDHVIRLGRSLLGRTPADLEDARSFFLPENVSDARIEEVGSRLAETLRVTVPARVGTETLVQADAVIFRRGVADAALFDAAPRLKLLQRLGESSHMIDLDEARRRGIHVSCLPRLSLMHVAEHAMMLMLALARKLLESDEATRRDEVSGSPGATSYNWSGISGVFLLCGKRLGIIGLGEVGIALARRARAFGMEVVCANRNPVPPKRLADAGATQVEIKELLRTSDFVSVNVPAAGMDRPAVGAAELALIRPEAFLINTARGVLVDEDALFGALSSGRLAGAGLDVHLREPRGRDRFATLPNVVLTPHMAGGSRVGVLDEIVAIFENVADVLEGRPPHHALLV